MCSGKFHTLRREAKKYGGPEGQFPRGKQRNLAEAPANGGNDGRLAAKSGNARRKAETIGNDR